MNKLVLSIITTVILITLSCKDDSINGPKSNESTNFQIEINNRQENSSLLLVYDFQDRTANYQTCEFVKKTNSVYDATCDLSQTYGFSLYLINYDTTNFDELFWSGRLKHTGVSDQHYFSSESINDDETISLNFDIQPIDILFLQNDSTPKTYGLISTTDSSYNTLIASVDYQGEGIDYFMYAYSDYRSVFLDTNGYQQIQGGDNHPRYKLKFSNDNMTLAFGTGWGIADGDIITAYKEDLSEYKMIDSETYKNARYGTPKFYSITTYLNGSLVSLDSGQQYLDPYQQIFFCEPKLNSIGVIESIELHSPNDQIENSSNSTNLEIADNRCTGEVLSSDGTTIQLDLPVYVIGPHWIE